MKESKMFAMRPFSCFVVLVSCLAAFGCGSDSDSGTGSDPAGLAGDEAGGSAAGDEASLQAEEVALEGYVTSAFEVVVDGERYADLEDFYTQELQRIPVRLREAGVPEGFTFDFEAQVGISDLWQNMRVYVSAVEDRGYLGTTRVNADGGFRLSFPWQASESEYKVRAVKRVGLSIQTASETIRYCYNFSARDQSVLLSEKEKPVILDEFETRITSYACSDEQSSAGLEIPYRSQPQSVLAPDPSSADDGSSGSPGTDAAASEQSEEESPTRLAPGATQAEVLAVFGEENISVQSDGWCVVRDAERLCAVVFISSCPCSVTFDEERRLSGQTNLQATLLDTVKW